MLQRSVPARLRRAAVLLSAAFLVPAMLACNSSETPETAADTIPFHVHSIYDPGADDAADIQSALAQASRQHKRVLLDFGGNWCGDCQVLDYYFHLPQNQQLLDRNFILVDVDIGQYDHNLDIARKYDIPLKKGVPALAVLDANGHLLFSQRNAQFEKMQRVSPGAVTQFLRQWKGSGGQS